MLIAASSAPRGVSANPDASPPRVSRGPAVDDTGRAMPWKPVQLRSCPAAASAIPAALAGAPWAPGGGAGAPGAVGAAAGPGPAGRGALRAQTAAAAAPNTKLHAHPLPPPRR